LVLVVALDECIPGAPFIRQQPAEHEQRVGPLRAGDGLRQPEYGAVVQGYGAGGRVRLQDDVRIRDAQEILAPEQGQRDGEADEAQRTPPQWGMESSHGVRVPRSSGCLVASSEPDV